MDVKLEKDKCKIEFTEKELDIISKNKTLIIHKDKVKDIVEPILVTCVSILEHYDLNTIKDKPTDTVKKDPSVV